MQLKEFSFISPVLESGLVFKAIGMVIPADVIAQTVGNTDSQEERKRKLPSQLVVCLVIAMSLWSSDSMTTVLKNLVNGLSRQWTRTGEVLASAEQRLDYNRPTTSWVPSDESIICANSATFGHP
jgi:hypothetical protein